MNNEGTGYTPGFFGWYLIVTGILASFLLGMAIQRAWQEAYNNRRRCEVCGKYEDELAKLYVCPECRPKLEEPK